MENKKIIISGASKGIGKDIFEYFLKKKYKVMCLSRNKPRIKHKNLFFLKIDMSNKANLKKNIKKIVSFDPKFLINNSANFGETGSFSKVNFDKWEKSFFLNFFSHAYLTRLLIKNIIKNKGKIFFMAGGGAANAFPVFSSYSVAKTAIVRLVENIAFENIGKLDCYAISPGAVKTKLLKSFIQKGHSVNKNIILNSDKCIKLIVFLMHTKKNFLSGRYLHALDPYKSIIKSKLKNDFLLRRNEDFKK